MHSDYEKYRPATDVKQVNVRISPEIITKLRILADIEEDSLSALVTEGIVRVIEDRVHNVNPAVRARLQERREVLEQERNLLESLMAQTED